MAVVDFLGLAVVQRLMKTFVALKRDTSVSHMSQLTHDCAVDPETQKSCFSDSLCWSVGAYENELVATVASARRHFLKRESSIPHESKDILRLRDFKRPASNPIDEVVPLMHASPSVFREPVL